MKMARATIEEAAAVDEFLKTLEEKLENGVIDVEWLDTAFREISSCWRRVVIGYQILHDNAADPTLSYLDWRPEIKAAIEAYK